MSDVGLIPSCFVFIYKAFIIPLNMMNVNLVSKITDYVLLNACSLHSSGLYTGKAGVSLIVKDMKAAFAVSSGKASISLP